MAKKLTDKQARILEYIRHQIAERGHSPTIREIGKFMGISSTNGVRMHLNALIRKGFLKKQQFIARGIELARPVSGGVGRIPLVGQVPAGSPIDAIENIEGEIAVDVSFLPKGDSFTLTVVGDSMKEAGIRNGDLVLVKKQETANKGDIVVAIIGEEATVKRFFPEGDRIRLQPENDDFEPIVVRQDSPEFRVVGKVVGLLRRID